MGKSILSIHKEIEKKEYAKSPIGQLEKKIRAFYDNLIISHKKLPESVAKLVNDHRVAYEEKYNQYVKDRIKADADAVDAMLLESFTKELEILNKNNAVPDTSTN